MSADEPERSADVPDRLSARRTITTPQLAGLIIAVLTLVVAAWRAPIVTGTVAMSLLIALYTAVLGLRIDLMARSRGAGKVVVADELAGALEAVELPTFTVMVPAYREPGVVAQLVGNLIALDYPTELLEVLFLLEADDEDTLAAFAAVELPAHMQVVTVPVAAPRTKPKALNYALGGSTGSIVTVYDAEDRPDPLQLRRVAAAFQVLPADVACIQAELAFFNADENIITRWFATEYRAWFGQFLPALARVDAPIPLGGTSNHIRREVLLSLGGWDPFNVTEDADLGIRLRRHGHRVAVLDSVTYEEANTDFVNWVKQRSRWYKGYLQTWLVHMRRPAELWRQVGAAGFVRFNLFVGGTPLLALLNPVSWTLVGLWFLLEPAFIRDIMPAPVYYAGLLGWLVGNFTFFYLNLSNAFDLRLRRIFTAALLLPLYWVMMSLAAVKACWQLVAAPTFWEKTEHGLSRQPMAPAGVEGTR